MEHASVKAYKGMGMEGRIARWYATNTGKRMEDFRALARRVAAELAPGSAVLELAPGPGYFAIELAKLSSFEVTGLDISKTFVEIARRNAQEARVAVDFRQGNASHIPFADDTFDFLLCRAAFKNFSDPLGAVREMYRVLKKGGRAVIIDLRRDASRKSVNDMVDQLGMGWASRIFTKLTFRLMLLKRAYTRSEFENFVSQTEFHHADIQETPTGLEITLRKSRGETISMNLAGGKRRIHPALLTKLKGDKKCPRAQCHRISPKGGATTATNVRAKGSPEP